MADVKPAVPAPAARGGSNAAASNAKGGAQNKGRGGNQATSAPIYPIEGLSPYQNKSVPESDRVAAERPGR